MRLLPTWKGNLLVFGLLILIVLAYFFWQLQQAHETFLNHARQHAGMLAGVIELNARGALLSQSIIEEIMQTFLGNTARFVDYLDNVEPFASEELAAFAQEAGLAGIRIVRRGGDATEGPPGWFRCPGDFSCTANARSLQHLPADHLYFLTVPRSSEPGCIITGITAARIEKLHEQVSLSRLLNTLCGLAGITYVRIEPSHCKNSACNKFKASRIPEVTLINTPEKKVAEARLPFREDVLVVALDATHFFVRIEQLRNEFFVFSAILAMLGIFFSWLLHRHQTAYLNRIRDFERELAREQEDAALGRAAAAITHEIRNPLNAISMGLQRLQIEADDLDEEYQNLVTTMLKAVQRTNSIVTNIRRYAGPLKPRRQAVRLNAVISHILSLYRQKCEEHAIEIRYEIRYEGTIEGDSELLEQVAENLIKNSIEAQPEGGYLHIIVDREGAEALFSVENRGLNLSEEEVGRIFEPYFTTKTRGTGLGLAIVRRIIRAHKGRVEADIPNAGVLRIKIYFKFCSHAPD
ncbi:MAG: hypothetical protein BWK80_31740 [Desulfobacteraceae bacterium IS3]|nr:MAG: hypothetical protein BWK80_31740 [Desulfobacteraceae bacterium IS3]